MQMQQKSPVRSDVGEPVYGALDLGTNNCRLLMAVPNGEGFHVIDAFSRMTRLGEGLAASRELSPAAMGRTLAALKSCAQKLNRRRVRRVRAVATEACRRAANCGSFLARVRSETGLALEIISAEEEASLALTGCAPLLLPTPLDGLVFDIGGGSTELIWVREDPARAGNRSVEAIFSLPTGVVNLAERFGAELQQEEGYEKIVREVTSQLQGFDPDRTLSRLAGNGALQMLGTSGTVTTLAGIHLDLARYDRAQVDGLSMSFSAIEAISTRLVHSSFEQRALHPCIGRERADLVVAGCAILAAICRLWPTGSLRIADRGVREGLLLEMMRADREVS